MSSKYVSIAELAKEVKRNEVQAVHSKFTVEELRVIQEMWTESISNSVGLCVICDVCGGSSRGRCDCARSRYYQSVTKEGIKTFREKKRSQQIEAKRRELKYLQEELDRLTLEAY